MTAAILPEFILKSMENEISKICLDVVHHLCDEYDLPFEEVKKKLARHICIDLNIQTTEVFRIVKRRPRKTIIAEPHLCIGNMYDFEEKCPRRCTLERKKDKKSGKYTSVFCTKHDRMSKCGRLSYGVSDEEEYRKYMKSNGMTDKDIEAVFIELKNNMKKQVQK